MILDFNFLSGQLLQFCSKFSIFSAQFWPDRQIRLRKRCLNFPTPRLDFILSLSIIKIPEEISSNSSQWARSSGRPLAKFNFQNSTMSPVLPFDIISLIIDIVGEHNDANLLKELALASHSFLPPLL